MSNIVIRRLLEENIRLHTAVLADETLCQQIYNAAQICVEALRKGGKILICGNGGSAADAQHMAAELVGRFQIERPGLAAIALNTDTSVLTAWTNDYGFENLFRRQVESLGKPGDVLIGISTSGNSPNVQSAVAAAAEMGVHTVGLLGKDGGALKDACEISLVVPHGCTARIQEVHITLIHILCELIETEIFSA